MGDVLDEIKAISAQLGLGFGLSLAINGPKLGWGSMEGFTFFVAFPNIKYSFIF